MARASDRTRGNGKTGGSGKAARTQTSDEILAELTRELAALQERPDAAARTRGIARVLHLLTDFLKATNAEPEYDTVRDHRGTPFGPGEPLPYRKGSKLHRALEIFRDHSLPITRARFVACGGEPRDLDRLIAAGHVARIGG
jgi:hypothetical protein